MTYRDKLMHLAVGTIIYVIVSMFSVIGASALVAVVGAGKEYYDSKHPDKHNTDGWDAYATLLGVPVGMLIVKLLNF